MPKYLVIEIWDREVQSATECPTLEAAIEKANELLKEHAKFCGHLDRFEANEGDESEWSLATENNLNAWENLSDDWDAHIFVMEDGNGKLL